LDGQLVEQVSEFKYLGSLISEDGYCEKEIHNRTGIGKKDIRGQEKNVHRQIKLGIEEMNYEVSSLEHSTVFCIESTLTEADRSRLEAFEIEILVWRRMEKISWKDKKTNKENLHMVLEDGKILNTIWY